MCKEKTRFSIHAAELMESKVAFSLHEVRGMHLSVKLPPRQRRGTTKNARNEHRDCGARPGRSKNEFLPFFVPFESFAVETLTP
jgi:hypothetical protein